MYYLYHIKGVKIGCSKNPNKRIKQQGYNEWEILETHNDIDVASVRERELQKQSQPKRKPGRPRKYT